MATLYLMVGRPGSGKSTLARMLEQEHAALRLTPDEWQLRLFGQDAEAPEHNARHTLIETLQWEVASRALALGINVILDYGFWAREEREDFRARAKQLGAWVSARFSARRVASAGSPYGHAAHRCVASRFAPAALCEIVGMMNTV